MRFKAFLGSLILAATCGAQIGPARAADLGALYAPYAAEAEPSQPLTFGTGWYLRGDAAYSEEDHPTYNATLNSFNRNATASGYSFGLGAGYQFNSWLRADITGDYIDPFNYRSTQSCGAACSLSVELKVQRWDGLANGYVDLGTWFGVTPYIGAGVGVAGTRVTGSVNLNGGPLPFPITTPNGTVTNQALPSRNTYQFAWAGMAGFSYAFASHALLDVGYRYLDLGRTTLPLYPLASVQKALTIQQVRVGVRYMID